MTTFIIVSCVGFWVFGLITLLTILYILGGPSNGDIAIMRAAELRNDLDALTHLVKCMSNTRALKGDADLAHAKAEVATKQIEELEKSIAFISARAEKNKQEALSTAGCVNTVNAKVDALARALRKHWVATGSVSGTNTGKYEVGHYRDMTPHEIYRTEDGFNA